MRIHNIAIANIFNDMADIIQIQGGNPFRIRAYRNAARTISGLSQNVSDLVEKEEDLSKLSGIGKDLALKIEEIVRTGHLSALDKLEKLTPPQLIEVMKISGLGGKRIAALHNKLGITSIDDLEKAAREHKICTLPGFGERIEKSILDGIEKSREADNAVLYYEAREISGLLLDYFKKCSLVENVTIAGSFRRRKEIVRDIDVLVTGSQNSVIAEYFLDYPDISSVISKGETRITVMLHDLLQTDIRIVPQGCYGSALHYFTGSKAHNIAVRKRGMKRDLKINEYGVFKGKKRIGGEKEEDVFSAVGLTFIEPELREDQGEIEAAQRGTLPDLIKVEHIRGDLHTHTNRTDGHASLEQMVIAAAIKGYEYIAVTDHSRRLAMAHGLWESDLEQQIEMINRVNETLKGITVLKGIEVDILENGTLDLPVSVLKKLDLTICAIHSKMNLSKEQQTKRILKAMDNPTFKILAHPTGRLLKKRTPYEVDIEKVLKGAKERGCGVEINSSPDRLDLNDINCKMAKEIGVKLVINTDAHSTNDLNNMQYGIFQARRGWVEPNDVVNTRTLEELKSILKRS